MYPLPSPPNVALALLGLSAACFIRCLRMQPLYHGGLFKDVDGEATNESEAKEMTLRPVVGEILFITPILGLGAALWHPVHPPSVLEMSPSIATLLRSTGPLLWSLLSCQAIAVFQQKDIQGRYEQSLYSAMSSVILITFLWYKATVLGQYTNWAQIGAAVAALFGFLSIPRRPVVFMGTAAVLNESGVSILDWVLFSWGLHQSSASLPASLRMQDLPKIPHSQSASTMRENYDACNKAEVLWRQLATLIFQPCLMQWILALLEALSEFGSRFVVHHLLECLENQDKVDAWTWTWVVLLPLSLLSDSICGNWSTWIGHTRIQLPILSLLQSLVFEKSLRLHADIGDKSAKEKLNHQAPSTMDAVFSHSNSVAQAFLGTHNLPIAALKICLYSVYLSHLMGFTNVLLGSTLPVMTLFLSRYLSKHLRAAQAEHLRATEHSSSLVAEALHGLRQIRLSSMEQFWQKRVFCARQRDLRLAWKVSLNQELMNLVVTLGPVLFASVTISIYALRTGKFSPSVAFTSINLFGNLHSIIKQLPTRLTSLHQARISYTKLETYLQLPELKKGSIPADSLFLRKADLSWAGDENSIVLRNVNLEFPRHGLSLITGRVGSGKSLLLSSILEETTLQSGTLGKQIPGTISNLVPPIDIISGTVAFVSQPPWIEDRTLKDNIIFGYDIDEQRYQEVIRVCALNQDFSVLKKGDLTMAGTNGSCLSGGQKWRVAFARALYSPAEFIISEDILAAVDAPIARHICEKALNGQLLDGRATILATHHPEYCSLYSEYLVSLQNGSATATCTPREKRSAAVSSETKNIKPSLVTAETPANRPDLNSTATAHTLPHANAQNYWATLREYVESSGHFRGYIHGFFIVLCYRVISASHSWWLAQWTSRESIDQSSPFYDVGIYLTLSVASAAFASAQALFFARIGYESSLKLFDRLIRRVVKAKISWIDTTPPGQVIQTLNSDMYAIDHRMAPQVIGVFSSGVQILTICISSFASSPYTILSSVIMLSLYSHVAQRSLHVSRKLRPLVNSCNFPISNHVSSTKDGVQTIRAFAKEQYYIDKMRSHIDSSNTASTHMALGLRWVSIRLGSIGSIFVATIAMASVWGHATASGTGLAITIALQLRQALNVTIGQINVTRTGLNAIERVLALASIPSEEGEDEDSTVSKNWPTCSAIRVQDLGIRYNDSLPWALRHITFSLGPRKRLGIVGRTGSGKSSLINALLRFIDAAEGQIFINDQDISHVPREHIRSIVTIIPQDAYLFSGTLRSNVDIFGKHDDDRIVSTLRRVYFASLEQDGDVMASDLDHEIHSGGSNISHGQRQLVCLARVMLQDECQILVLDEATSGIDHTTETAIQRAIRENFSDKTILVVAHKLFTVADFDSILILSQGELVEMGAPQQLLANKGQFWSMVEQSEDAKKTKDIILANGK